MENKKFQEACENGDLKTVQAILKTNVSKEEVSYALAYACGAGQFEVANLLIKDKRADPTFEDHDALFAAIESNNADVLKLVLGDKRVDPTYDDDRAILEASYMGNTKAVKLLLNTKANPNACARNDGHNPLCKAALGNHMGVIKLLLSDERVDPAADDSIVLRVALKHGSYNVVDVLLEDGRVDVETSGTDDNDDKSALEIAEEAAMDEEAEEMFSKLQKYAGKQKTKKQKINSSLCPVHGI